MATKLAWIHWAGSQRVELNSLPTRVLLTFGADGKHYVHQHTHDKAVQKDMLVTRVNTVLPKIAGSGPEDHLSVSGNCFLSEIQFND